MTWHRRFLGLVALLALATVGACGDDSAQPGAPSGGPRDAAADEPEPYDAGPLPDLPVHYDAGGLLAGSPPPELAGEACAVHENKLFELVTVQGHVEPAALAVDLFENRFGVGFVDDGMCLDGAFVAELAGPSGGPEPEVSPLFDECSTIQRLAMTHNTTEWLVASADNRDDGSGLWVQAVRPGGPTFPAHLVADTFSELTTIAVVGLPPDQALAAWVERDAMGATALRVRPLDAVGMPTGDAVTLEEDEPGVFYGDLTLSLVGQEGLVALGYVRSEGLMGDAVLQVLDDQGEPAREAWVLASDARIGGTVDLAADETGGAVIYGRALGGDARQLWFQQLGADGQAAPVMAGGSVLGPARAQRLINSPERAIDASIAQLPNGFAIVYRALEGGRRLAGDERIMVQFVDRFGGIRGPASAIALAEPVGGKTAIEAAYDGRIVVAWHDIDEQGNRKLTVIRLPCVGGRQ